MSCTGIVDKMDEDGAGAGDSVCHEHDVNDNASEHSEKNLPGVPGSGTDSTDLIEAQPKVVIRKPGYAPIKQEFLVLDYKPTLHTEYLSSEMKEKIDSADNSNKDSTNRSDAKESDVVADDDAEDDSEPPNKKAKLKGRNKHRPRNERIQDKDRICPSVKWNRECRYGDKCKFSHNKEDFMSKKLPELDGTCYLFDTFGYCSYGIACRFAKNHLSEDLQNIKNEELYEKMKSYKLLNELPVDVRHKLWKKKYNFKKADKVVKDVQKNFRGMDIPDSSPAAEDHGFPCDNATAQKVDPTPVVNTVNIPGSNFDEKITGESEAFTGQVKQQEITVQKNADSTIQTEMPAMNSQVVTQTEDGKRTLGCITDEEIIRVRPQEKVKIDLRNKLYLAPLTTVGNLPFRRVCKGLGAEVTCGEMALVPQLLKAKQSEWSLIKRHPCEDIFGVQICGFNPDTMTRCAQLLTETCDVDFIDINCGCPIDMVYKKGGGSALMGKVTKLEQMCRSMMGVMDGTPLTVKLRTGVFDNKSVAHQIIPRLRDAGVSLVTIHGRSREQRYTKQADWDYIAQCASAGAPMPVFGNGDILSYEDANLHMQHSGVSGIMIARGALIKPWIFTEIKEQRHWDISSGERLDILRNFTNYGLEHWGSDHQGVENTRRFLLEWLSFTYRYIPVGVLEQVPQRINERPPYYVGRNDLETLMASASCADWIKISEMLLGPVPPSFQFLPKHKANAYQ